MDSGIGSLHKILKNETRRKIIILLNEKGELSYTDLMETLGFVTTGRLNYHLKVLGELLSKNEIGQYSLTEKGKLASKLLLEFPENTVNGGQGKLKWWQTGRLWQGVFVGFIIVIVLGLLFHFTGHVVGGVIGGITAAVIAKGGTLRGMLAGGLVGIFGGIIIIVVTVAGSRVFVGIVSMFSLLFGVFGDSLGRLHGLWILGIAAITLAAFGAIASTIGGFIGGLISKKKT